MSIIIHKCLYCKKDLKYLPPSAIKKGEGKFCCFEHYQKYMVENGLKKGSNNPLYSKVEKVCPICKKHFFVKQNTLKKGFGIYCSKKCKGKAVMCKEKNPNWTGGKIIKQCKHCGKPIIVKRSAVSYGDGKYCSKKCWGAAHSGINNPMYGADRALEKNPNWNGGTSYLPYPIEWNKDLRLRIRAPFNFTCVECHRTEAECGHILCCHHVNYDKKAPKEGDRKSTRLNSSHTT
jgi:hypothetical protein